MKSLTSDQYASQQIPALLGYQKASVCVNQSDILYIYGAATRATDAPCIRSSLYIERVESTQMTYRLL